MEDHYYLNYFNSISDGLKSTKYYTDKKSVQPNVFFNTINELIIKLKNSNHKIYFFGNGASAAFANHMALDFSKNGKY